jgi:RNA polymerase sigma-70 factor (ECF subfamily)
MNNRTNTISPAVEALYHEHRRPIQAYLARLIDDRAAAEDLCQETFLKALRGWAGHDPAASPVAWLYRIATNTAYDHLRRRRRANLAPLFVAETIPSTQGAPAQLNEYEPLYSALARLPPHYRIPLLLHACEGQSLREIADALGCSYGAVKMRLLRARQRFRQIYSDPKLIMNACKR